MNIDKIKANAPEGATDYQYFPKWGVAEYYMKLKDSSYDLVYEPKKRGWTAFVGAAHFMRSKIDGNNNIKPL